jgi:hypothetical protein
MTLIEQLKKHWIGSVIMIAAICISTTWLVSIELFVKPRDFRIEELRSKIADLNERIKELQTNPSKDPVSHETELQEKIASLEKELEDWRVRARSLEDELAKVKGAVKEPTPQSLPEKLAISGANASSQAYNNSTSAMKALDKDIYSRWSSADDDVEGSWLELVLPETRTVTSLRIYMVIQKNSACSQIKDADLVVPNSAIQKITFPFKNGWQQVNIAPVKTSVVRISVKSVYPGQSHPNKVEVYEVQLYGK